MKKELSNKYYFRTNNHINEQLKELADLKGENTSTFLRNLINESYMNTLQANA